MLFKCQPTEEHARVAGAGFKRTFGVDAIGSTLVYETAIQNARMINGDLMSLKVVQLAQFGLTESGQPLLEIARPGIRTDT